MSKAQQALCQYKESKLFVRDVVKELMRSKDHQLVRTMNKHEAQRNKLERKIGTLHSNVRVSKDQVEAKEMERREHAETIQVLNRLLMANMGEKGSTSSSGGALNYQTRELLGELFKRQNITVQQDPQSDLTEQLQQQLLRVQQELQDKVQQEKLLQGNVASMRYAMELLLTKSQNSMEEKGREAVDQLVTEANTEISKIKELQEDPNLMRIAQEREKQLAEMSAARKTIDKLANEKKSMETALRKAEQEVVQMRLKMMERDSSMAVVSKKIKSIEAKLEEESSTSQYRIEKAERQVNELRQKHDEELQKVREALDEKTRKVMEQTKMAEHYKGQLSDAKFESQRIRKELECAKGEMERELKVKLKENADKVAELESNLKEQTAELESKCAVQENLAFRRGHELSQTQSELEMALKNLKALKDDHAAQKVELEQHRQLADAEFSGQSATQLKAEQTAEKLAKVQTDLTNSDTALQQKLEECETLRIQLKSVSIKLEDAEDKADKAAREVAEATTALSEATRKMKSPEPKTPKKGLSKPTLQPVKTPLLDDNIAESFDFSTPNDLTFSKQESTGVQEELPFAIGTAPTPPLTPKAESVLSFFPTVRQCSQFVKNPMLDDISAQVANVSEKIHNLAEWRSSDPRARHPTIAVQVDSALMELTTSLLEVAAVQPKLQSSATTPTIPKTNKAAPDATLAEKPLPKETPKIVTKSSKAKEEEEVPPSGIVLPDRPKREKPKQFSQGMFTTKQGENEMEEEVCQEEVVKEQIAEKVLIPSPGSPLSPVKSPQSKESPIPPKEEPVLEVKPEVKADASVKEMMKSPEPSSPVAQMPVSPVSKDLIPTTPVDDKVTTPVYRNEEPPVETVSKSVLESNSEDEPEVEVIIDNKASTVPLSATLPEVTPIDKVEEVVDEHREPSEVASQTSNHSKSAGSLKSSVTEKEVEPVERELENPESDKDESVPATEHSRRSSIDSVQPSVESTKTTPIGEEPVVTPIQIVPEVAEEPLKEISSQVSSKKSSRRSSQTAQLLHSVDVSLPKGHSPKKDEGRSFSSRHLKSLQNKEQQKLQEAKVEDTVTDGDISLKSRNAPVKKVDAAKLTEAQEKAVKSIDIEKQRLDLEKRRLDQERQKLELKNKPKHNRLVTDATQTSVVSVPLDIVVPEKADSSVQVELINDPIIVTQQMADAITSPLASPVFRPQQQSTPLSPVGFNTPVGVSYPPVTIETGTSPVFLTPVHCSIGLQTSPLLVEEKPGINLSDFLGIGDADSTPVQTPPLKPKPKPSETELEVPITVATNKSASVTPRKEPKKETPLYIPSSTVSTVFKDNEVSRRGDGEREKKLKDFNTLAAKLGVDEKFNAQDILGFTGSSHAVVTSENINDADSAARREEFQLLMIVAELELQERSLLICSWEQQIWEVHSAFHSIRLCQATQRSESLFTGRNVPAVTQAFIQDFIAEQVTESINVAKSNQRDFMSLKATLAGLSSDDELMKNVMEEFNDSVNAEALVLIDEKKVLSVSSQKYNATVRQFQTLRHQAESQQVVLQLHQAGHEATKQQLADVKNEVQKLTAKLSQTGTRSPSQTPRNESFAPAKSPMASPRNFKQPDRTDRATSPISLPSAASAASKVELEEHKRNLTTFFEAVGGFMLEAQSLVKREDLPNQRPLVYRDRPLLSVDQVQQKLNQLLESLQKAKTVPPKPTEEMLKRLKDDQKKAAIAKVHAARIRPAKEEAGLKQDKKYVEEIKKPKVPIPELKLVKTEELVTSERTNELESEARCSRKSSATPSRPDSSHSTIVPTRDPIKSPVQLVDCEVEAQEDLLNVPEILESLDTVKEENDEFKSRLETLLEVLNNHEALARAAAHVEQSKKSSPGVRMVEMDVWEIEKRENQIQRALHAVKHRLEKLKMNDVLDAQLRAGVAVALDNAVEDPARGTDVIAVLSKTRARALQSLISHVAGKYVDARDEQEFLSGMFRSFPKAFVEHTARHFDPEIAYELVMELSRWWNKHAMDCDQMQAQLLETKQESLNRIVDLCDLLESVTATVNVEYHKFSGRVAMNSRERERMGQAALAVEDVAQHVLRKAKMKKLHMLKELSSSSPGPFSLFTKRSEFVPSQVNPDSDPILQMKIEAKLNSLRNPPQSSQQARMTQFSHSDGTASPVAQTDPRKSVKLSFQAPTVATLSKPSPNISDSQYWNTRAQKVSTSHESRSQKALSPQSLTVTGSSSMKASKSVVAKSLPPLSMKQL